MALLKVRQTNGPNVHLADDSTIKATAMGLLPLTSALSDTAKHTYIFGELSTPLISLGQLCNDGCNVLLTRKNLVAVKNNTIVLTGTRNPIDKLWDVPLPQQPTPITTSEWTTVPVTKLTTHNNNNQSISSTQRPSSLSNNNRYAPLFIADDNKQHKANIILRADKSKMELAQWLHACCGSPTINTFCKAIDKGNFITWPGLTSNLIKNNLPLVQATAKGHLNQERKNLQSTKPGIILNKNIKIEADIKQENDLFPSSDSPNNRTHQCFATIESFETTAKAYSDQTGRFPFTSSRGNQYLMIIYDYDSNAILHEPLKNRTATELTRAWTAIHQRLSIGGSKPEIYILDNEFSTEFETNMKNFDVKFQLVPPHIHRRNAAERAIQTFKHHFLAILASCDRDFPIKEWDRLLDQAEITLNLLRNFQNQPKVICLCISLWSLRFQRYPVRSTRHQSTTPSKNRTTRFMVFPL